MPPTDREATAPRATDRKAPTQVTDLVAALILRTASGDVEAFTALYDSTSSRAYGLALRILRDHREAEDVIKDVYLRLWTTSRDFDASSGSGASWVLSIAHRHAADRVGHAAAARHRDAGAVDSRQVAPEVSTSSVAASELDTRDVRSLLCALPPAQRTVIELAYLDGLTLQQVAQRLQISTSTARTRTREGMMRLHATMAARGLLPPDPAPN